MRWRWFFIVPAAMAGMLLFAALGGTVVRLLWNWLLPPLFGWRELTFWQALGMLALCRILFGGSGFFGSARRNSNRRIGRRWERMTPEERERFERGMRGRCGFGPATNEGTGR